MASDRSPAEDPAYEAKVLRSFVKGDRLASIPARDRKRQVILRFLVDRVLPDDGDVDEPELNARLARWNPDFSALRRYLVDAGLVTRTGMTYRRVRREPAPPERPESPPRGV